MKNVTVVFRYDDFGDRTDIAFERRLREAFERFGVSATYAVTPFAEYESPQGTSANGSPRHTAEEIELLRQGLCRGKLEVALHGYAHKKTVARAATEFAGVNDQVQYQKLDRAKKTLEAALASPIYSFVPPWNTYDTSTLAALERLGFVTISASVVRRIPAVSSRLKFLPATCSLLQVRQAVCAAMVSADPAPIIVCLLHPVDFAEINPQRGIDLVKFGEMLQWISQQEGVVTRTIGEVVASHVDLGITASRAMFARATFPLLSAALPPMRHYSFYAVPSRPIPASTLLATCLKTGCLYLLLLLATIAAATIVIRQILTAYPCLLIPAALAVFVALIACGRQALADRIMGYRGMLAVTALLGGEIAIGLSWFISRHG
jgi:peptidoglycan/xylan/chitin deacetylase (PgdA/CDA1 family)